MWHFPLPRDQTGGMVLGVKITKRTSLTRETRGRVTTHMGAPSQPLCACPRDPPLPPPPPAVSTYSRATPDNGLTSALKRQSSTHLCGKSSAFMDWTQNRPTFLKVLTFRDLSSTSLKTSKSTEQWFSTPKRHQAPSGDSFG